jgi:hypothetical protein
MLNQMSRESGGNPAAINLTDINAQQGHPSKGLLQFIDGTFQRFADPGYNTNIYDPQSQMRAWYNYINSNYGGFAQFAGRGYGPYAAGGVVSGPGSGTSDSIPARVSNGEFIVNARSASNNMGLLHAINGYAGGGLVGRSALAGIGAAQLGDRQGNIVAALASIAQTLADAATAAMDAASKRHDAQVQYNQDHDTQIRADRAYEKSKTAANLQAKKAADAAAAASLRTLTNTRTTAAVAAHNAAAAASAQKSLQATYHNMQAIAARYDSVTGRLDTARGDLASSISNKAQAASGYASSVAGYDGGLTGHSDVRGTSGSVVNGLRFDLGKIQAFRSDIAKLTKQGLGAGLLSQLVNSFGSGGEITAHALASGPLGNIRAANSLQAQITSASASVGATVASAQFNPIIRSQQNLVNSLGYQQRALNATLVRYAAGVEARLTHALSGWSVRLDPQGVLKLVQRGQQLAGGR